MTRRERREQERQQARQTRQRVSMTAAAEAICAERDRKLAEKLAREAEQAAWLDRYENDPEFRAAEQQKERKRREAKRKVRAAMASAMMIGAAAIGFERSR